MAQSKSATIKSQHKQIHNTFSLVLCQISWMTNRYAAKSVKSGWADVQRLFKGPLVMNPTSNSN